MATLDLSLGPALRGRELVPSQNYHALSGGAGGRGMPTGGVNKKGNLKLCSKPLPVFKQQFKATKSSGEKDFRLGQQANHFSPCTLSLPPGPYPPLPDCYTRHPLPSVLVPLYPRPPDGKVGWWEVTGDPNISVSPAPLSVSPCVQGCPRVPDVPTSIEGCFCGTSDAPLGYQPLIPSVSLCPCQFTPHSCPLRQKQPLVSPHRFAPCSSLLSGPPGSLCVSFL